MSEKLRFPENFLWGTSVSSYQVEGGLENTNWSDIFPAGKACDHYNRYQEDFDIADLLNLNTFRLSIEWARIEPKPGKFNKKEIEHYRKVFKTLKEKDMEIMLTLNHFTLPKWVSDCGGWPNSEMISFFANFVEKTVKEYGDLVDFWITINEPLVLGGLSYWEGEWPPRRKNLFLLLKAIRNQVRAHKKAYGILHEKMNDAKVGIAKNNQYFEPFNKNSVFDKISSKIAAYFWNRYFLDEIRDEMDFIGLNYYFHNKVKFPWRIENDNETINDLGWEIYPEGIYHALKELKEYEKPVYVTENGVADSNDKLRKNFIKSHLRYIHKAIEEKTDVRGYFYWSLIDNFEWDKGFKPRFGLVEIDYDTLRRKIRPSAFYYSNIAKSNQLEI